MGNGLEQSVSCTEQQKGGWECVHSDFFFSFFLFFLFESEKWVGSLRAKIFAPDCVFFLNFIPTKKRS